MKKIILTTFSSLSILLNINAQETILSTGNTMSNTSGSISYSIGQLYDSDIVTNLGEVCLGIQYPYDIYKIYGNFITPNNKPIGRVVTNYGTPIQSSLQTKSSYNISVANSTYVLKPTKNNDINKTNGVNGADVIAVQRHFLNLTKITNAYKLIAADVTGDKTINGTDILRMKRLILTLDTTFNSTLRGARLWEFVDSAYTFPDTTNPFPFKDSISFTNLTSNKTNQTFIGVKLGDVNYSWDNTLARGNLINNLELIASSKQQLTTKHLPLTISTKNFEAYNSFQYTLHFDNTKYEFVGIENNKFNIDFNSNQANETGNIAILWADANGEERTLDDGTELFTLLLKPKMGISNWDLETDEKLILNNDVTEIAAYDKDFVKHNILLKSKVKSDNPKVQWFSIFPNPAKDIVNIDCANATTVVIINALGKIVYQNTSSINRLSLNTKKFAKGLFIVQVTFKDGTVKSEKLIVE